MNRTIAAAAAAILSLTMSVSAFAAEGDLANVLPAAGQPAMVRADHIVWGDYAEGAENIVWGAKKVSRPTMLPALYASYAALQAYDMYSTKQALARGAREANPLMRGVVGNTGAFVAMKVGVGVATIMAAERLWKTNKAAAIGVMIAGNSVAAVVAARNARTLRNLR
jgi:hypothetical protein